MCIALFAAGCKEAYIPPAITSDNNRYLVVEGVVNNSDTTYINIGHTQKIDTIYTNNPEANAMVSVESDVNNTFQFIETVAGTYAAAPLQLDQTHKYRLRIKTADKREYVSDFVIVKNSPPIDSVGFIAQSSGVQIYVNSHDPGNATRYYRWKFTKDWQFHSKYLSAWIFGNNWIYCAPSPNWPV